MKLSTLAAALSLAALLAGCNRNTPAPTPTPKTSAAAPSSSAGDSAPVRSSVNNGSGNSEDDRNGGNPHAQQIDPNQAEQRRGFQSGDGAPGPKSADTAPRMRNQ